MCSLRDAAKQLADLGVTIYGISTDDVQSQATFAKAQKLPFSLLSDPDAGVTGKYGVLWAGRPFSKRVTFVIDDQGVLRLIDDDVQVTHHGIDLVAAIRKLRDS